MCVLNIILTTLPSNATLLLFQPAFANFQIVFFDLIKYKPRFISTIPKMWFFISNGSGYTRMGLVKFAGEIWRDMICLDHITSNFSKAVIHKFYLVHSWIPWPKYSTMQYVTKLWRFLSNDLIIISICLYFVRTSELRIAKKASSNYSILTLFVPCISESLLKIKLT